jgi:GT2 family glycosyltransferase
MIRALVHAPESNGRRPSLGVVVPATDAAPFLERCLASIAAADEPPEEVIVVDRAGMTVVDARNHGARRATAAVLAFVDSDVLVHRDAFTRIRTSFARDPELIGLLGSYDDSPTARGAISGFRNLLHHHICAAAEGQVATFWTGLGSVRREAFEAVGGFDDELRWPPQIRDQRDFMADVSFGIRLVEAGHRIELDPQIRGTHLKHWTLGQMIYTDFVLRGVPWVRLLLRRRDVPPHLNLGWRHRISALISLLGAGALLRRRVVPALTLAGALVAMNRPFYALLLRRRGPRETAGGVVAHMIHHLVSLASVLAGLAIHLVEGRRAKSIAVAPEVSEEDRRTEVPTVEVATNGARARETAPSLSG